MKADLGIQEVFLKCLIIKTAILKNLDRRRGYWDLLETAKPWKKSSKTAKKINQNQITDLKKSQNRETKNLNAPFINLSKCVFVG